MTVKLYGWDGNPFDQNSIDVGNRFIKTIVKAVLSGNYTTGGDTLDWTNGGGTPALPTTVPQAQNRGIVRVVENDSGPTGGILANGGQYAPIPGTLLTNWLLKIFATAGAQYANGAYGADATTDTLIMEVWWAR